MRRLHSLETPKTKYLAQWRHIPEEMKYPYSNSFEDETERAGTRLISILREDNILRNMK